MEFTDHTGAIHQKPPEDAIGWRISVYVVVEHEGRILLVHQPYSTALELPGGAIEIGESIADTARREFEEETLGTLTSIDSTPFYVHESFFYNDSTEARFFHSICLFYRATIDSSGEPRTHAGIEVVWVNKKRGLQKENIQPIHKMALKVIA